MTKQASFPSKNIKLFSVSPEETFAAGRTLGVLLEAGDVVALQGELGAGKTVFAKGIAAALGVMETVTSPTYNIISEYNGEKVDFYHIDAYRLSGADEFCGAGGMDALFSDNGVAVVEWSERLKGILPCETIIIKLNIIEDNSREITRL